MNARTLRLLYVAFGVSLVATGAAVWLRDPAPEAPPPAASGSAPAPTRAPPEAPSPSAPPALPPEPPPSRPAPVADAGGSDFEDQFHYGQIDAGAGDPADLARHPGYEGYGNARFGFSVEVPRALTAMPEPTNGDGLQWRLGGLVAMTASGMYALSGEPPACASSPDVTGHTESSTSCWATGKRDGYIFWERTVVKGGVLYSLRFQYRESVKAAMDAVVAHVNGSWRFGASAK